MKKIFFFLALTLGSLAAKAVAPGWYVGCAGGYAYIAEVGANGQIIQSYQHIDSRCNRDWAVRVGKIAMPVDPTGNPTDAGTESLINSTLTSENRVETLSEDIVRSLEESVAAGSATGYVCSCNLTDVADATIR